MWQGQLRRMQIGKKGVKYGLQIRAPGKDARKPVGGQALAPARVAAAFGGDDSDSEEDNVGVQLARQAARKQSDTKVGTSRTASFSN